MECIFLRFLSFWHSPLVRLFWHRQFLYYWAIVLINSWFQEILHFRLECSWVLGFWLCLRRLSRNSRGIRTGLMRCDKNFHFLQPQWFLQFIGLYGTCPLALWRDIIRIKLWSNDWFMGSILFWACQFLWLLWTGSIIKIIEIFSFQWRFICVRMWRMKYLRRIQIPKWFKQEFLQFWRDIFCGANEKCFSRKHWKKNKIIKSSNLIYCFFENLMVHHPAHSNFYKIILSQNLCS